MTLSWGFFFWLCRYLVISEKLEEIKSFRELTCLDLSCCKLGDEHELLEHLTKEALSRYQFLELKMTLSFLPLSSSKNQAETLKGSFSQAADCKVEDFGCS